MGFFSRPEHTEPEPHHEPEPVHDDDRSSRRGGFFHRRDPSPTPSSRTSTSSVSSMSHHTDNHSMISGRRSVLSKFGAGGRNETMDPTIIQARERVMAAEASEREADNALEQARQSVREAREHVRRLEEEAKEEARRAKIKQYHAREVSKRGQALGRHG